MLSHAERLASVIRHQLLEVGRAIPRRKRVAVALSGGVDSCSILAALLRCKVKPLIVSYTPSTHQSTDFKMAKAAAESLGLEFCPAVFEMSPEELERCARLVIALGYVGKVQVECLTPLVAIHRAAAASGAKVVLTGDQADGYFALSKWASHNMERAKGVPKGQRTNVQADTTPERIDQLRERYWRLDKSCSEGVKRIGEKAGLSVWVPYRHRPIHDSFLGTLWRDVNRPRLKEPIRLAFEELDTVIPTRKLPVNLHKGDSEFAATMGRVLLSQSHLQGSWSTARGLYGAIARGEL